MENIVNSMRQVIESGKTMITNNLLAISIEGMNLKLLACQKEKVLDWSITPVNPKFLRGGFVVNPRGLASVINKALSKKGFSKQQRVLASVPGFHSICHTLEFPKIRELRPETVIPQQVRRDLGYSEANNLLFWQPLKSTGIQQSFFVVFVPKEPVVNLIETLKLAGLQPDKIEVNTFALSRAVNQSQAIIIAVEPNSLDSIIVRDNIPLATRSTFLGEGQQDIRSLPTLVTDALDGIMTFYNESHPDNPIPPDIPVHLLGSGVALNPDIVTAVEATLGRSVSQFEPPIVYPTDFPKTELAVNIGLILKEL